MPAKFHTGAPRPCRVLKRIHEEHIQGNFYWDPKDTFIGTPKIYTTTGLGPKKNREMAGVDDLVVYMQAAVKYSSLYMHHPGGASQLQAYFAIEPSLALSLLSHNIYPARAFATP